MEPAASKKDIVFLAGVNAPPLTPESRREAGFYLNLVQDGSFLSMPIARPSPSIGPRVHELRLSDVAGDCRIVYRIDDEEIIVVETFRKRTQKTPQSIIDLCKQRLAAFDSL